MSALFNTIQAGFEPMTEQRLGEVVALERRVYEHPWTRGNFIDSLRSGYHARLLVAGGGGRGHYVPRKGGAEVHLLNPTVAPEHQGQGWGRTMLDGLALWAGGEGAQWLWLEVRASNARAQRIYDRYGYRRVGERRHYYPAGSGRREDAIVMSFKL